MSAYLPRQGTDPTTTRPRAASKAGARMRRLVAVLAGVTAAFVASAVAVPAAFARVIPPPGGSYGPSTVAPVRESVVRVTAHGTPDWQIAVIALGAALLGAAAVVLLERAAPGPAAVPPLSLPDVDWLARRPERAAEASWPMDMMLNWPWRAGYSGP